MKRRRWIRAASVRSGWYVTIANAGYPGGLLVNWRGQLLNSQRCEFLTWEVFYFELRHRLAVAGLAAVAVATQLPRELYQPVMVEVERAKSETRVAAGDPDWNV